MNRIAVPKKVAKRLSKETCSSQRILAGARSREVSQPDTVLLVTEMLEGIFGWDGEGEVEPGGRIGLSTGRLIVRSEGRAHFLVEIVAVGEELSSEDLRRALRCASKHDVSWIALTNGPVWELYRVDRQAASGVREIESWDFFEIAPRSPADLVRLYLLSREGIEEGALDERYRHVQAVNRFSVGAAIQSDRTLDAICRELQSSAPGMEVSHREVRDLLGEILQREVLERTPSEPAPSRPAETDLPSVPYDNALDGTSIRLAYWAADSLRQTH